MLTLQIIHNPGVIPDPHFNDTNTDITVVFEEKYSEYANKQAALAALPQHRSAYCYMINSVPSMSTDDLKKYVSQLSQKAEYVFVTDNSQDFYESFGKEWAKFADAVPKK